MKILILILLSIASCLTSQSAETVRLAWDSAPSHTNLLRYVVKQGVASGTYTNLTQVPTNSTTAVITNLPRKMCFFVVTAVNVAGLESDPSNELSVDLEPPAPPVPPSGLRQVGVGLTLKSSGSVSGPWVTAVDYGMVNFEATGQNRFFRVELSIK